MHQQRQKGAALFVGLVTLLVLTVIGLHASRSATMSLIAASNAQESALALAAAEDSVALGEQATLARFGGTAPGDLDTDATDGFYNDGSVALDTLDWDQANGIERIFDADGNLLGEFVVEYLFEGEGTGDSIVVGAAARATQIYRVTGRGVGARGSQRLVQTIFSAQD